VRFVFRGQSNGLAAGDEMPGKYRPTPPNFPAPAFTNWGAVTPFVLDRADQFRPGPPPALTSATYAAAINEVKSLGSATSTTRTAEQTQIGKFWNPPIQNFWNQIAETVALSHHGDLPTTARLFAALNLSFADSAIAFYDAKYTYLLWRPVTAIRLADTDGNPNTVADPNWVPLAGNTAADPSYPGAHSTISSAAAVVLASFYRGDQSFSVTSPALPGVIRSFARRRHDQQPPARGRGQARRRRSRSGTSAKAGFAVSKRLTAWRLGILPAARRHPSELGRANDDQIPDGRTL
jgi:hypothetical protein